MGNLPIWFLRIKKPHVTLATWGHQRLKGWTLVRAGRDFLVRRTRSRGLITLQEILKERGPVFGADRVGSLVRLLPPQCYTEIAWVKLTNPVSRIGEEDLAILHPEGRWICLTCVESIEAGRGGMLVMIAVGKYCNIPRARFYGGE